MRNYKLYYKIRSRKTTVVYNANDGIVDCPSYNGDIKGFKRHIKARYGVTGSRPSKKRYEEGMALVTLFKSLREY